MPDSPIEATLSRLRQRAHEVMTDAEARALHDEIAAHLDADVQARMELGAEREQAEREAVAAFGPVERLVTGVSRVKEPTLWHRIWLAGTLTAASPLMLVGMNSRSSWWVPVMVMCGVGLSWVAGAHLKRVPGRLLAAAACIFWVGASWRDATDTVQIGDSDWDRASLPAAVQELDARTWAERNHLRNLEAALVDYRRNGGLQVSKDYDRDSGELIFTQVATQEEAGRHWKSIERLMPTMQAVLRETEEQALIHRQGLRRGVLSELPRSLVAGLLPTAVLSLLWFALHASIVAIARMTRKGRQRRPRTT